MRYLFFSIFIISHLFGNGLEDRISILEQEIKQVGTTNEAGTFGASLQSDTFEKGWIGLQLHGAPLYWHAKVGGTEYVYELTTGSKGKVETQSFDWDWGYRLEAFLRLPIVKWEIEGTYTHFGTQDKEGRGIVPPSLLVSLKGGVVPPHLFAISDYKIDYDNVALSVEQSSFLSRLLGFSTEMGLRKAWIDQNQGVTYEGNEKVRIKDHCRFLGIGPFLGLKLRWYILSNVSLISSAEASLLYGNFEVKHHENQIELYGNRHLFSPALHFFAGLNWDFPMNWAQLSCSLGYEVEYFWRQNQSVEIENNTSGGFRVQLIRYADDLTFYGLTMKIGIEF
ncbi:MAG: hypothetical protein H7A38_01580 [Chlamydiales bacterium]|nr:hypothetical protein [Chlamydiales bacterium]